MCARMLAWLAVAVALCGPAATHSFLNNFGDSLMTDMEDVMEISEVPYIEPVDNTSYVSSAVFDMRAMGHLYNASHVIIDFISKKNAYPEGILKVSDGHLEFASPKENWRTLVAHYAGPVAIITIALLFIIGMPLAGLFWCCCYWCRSSRRRRPFDRKYDGCVKVMLAILLITLLTLFLFGLVCVFATEQQLEEGVSKVPRAVREGAAAARAFLNTTDQHAQILLVSNFGQLSASLMALFTRAGLTVSIQLGQFSNAVSVTLLNKMVQQLDDVQRDLRTVQDTTATLRFKAEQLNTGLRKVKRKLLRTLVECDMPPCLQLQHKYRISELDTDIQYSQMPDVSELLNNVTSLLDSRIKEEVADGQRVFRDIQRGIQRSVDDHIPVMRDVVKTIGTKLQDVANEFSYKLGNVSVQIGEAADSVEGYSQLYDQYGFIRRYTALGAAAALLLITCVLAWGLMCGVCGKRPDVYGASDCCNKGAGSKCLLCGMVIMFVCGGVVTALMLAYFVAGLAANRLVCDPLTEPRGNRLIADVEKFVDIERTVFKVNKDPEFTLTGIMVRCHANKTLYETLRLKRTIDLSALRSRLEGEVSARAAALRPVFPSSSRRVTILKDSAKRKLRQLADTGLSEFSFERILSALETNVTSLELVALAATLNRTAAAVAERAGYSAVSADLRAAAEDLLELQDDIVTPMMAYTDTLNETAIRLRDEIRFNRTSLKDAISYLMYETSQAEQFLNTRGAEMLQNITRRFTSMVTGMVSSYMEKLVQSTTTNLGRCGPLSQAFNSTRDAGCRHILLPVHGYWLSVAWCVVLFIPILVVSHRLARLYLQVDPYPGPLVEAEYLYDAYADRDNVPLANAYKAEKRSRGASRAPAAASGAGPCDGRTRGEAVALAAPSDDHHARRYNDMAPKHWEEGPPRYHGPTEYERPPPYYYPGPNDRQ